MLLLRGIAPIRHGGLVALLRDEVAGRWWQTCKMGVPALAYTVQGNLLFVALANLEAPTYQAPSPA